MGECLLASQVSGRGQRGGRGVIGRNEVCRSLTLGGGVQTTRSIATLRTHHDCSAAGESVRLRRQR